ncbi:MAG: peptidylprolyl isomerase [Thiobacillaceae bacterium]
MRKTLLTSLILLAFAPMAYAEEAKPADAKPAAAPAAQETSKPIAIVNGKEIPVVYGEILKRELLAQGQPDNEQLASRVRDTLVNAEILSRAAIDKGLDKDPRIAAVLDIQRKNALSKVYLEDYIKSHPVTEAEMQTEYDKAKASASANEYHARHILVKTEAEAKKLIADLGKKAKFEDLAKKYSQDPGSAKNGGDLNWSDSGAFVKEFSEAMVGLKKGEVTKTAVKTQFGYHIIKLEDVRPLRIPPLSEVKADVQKQLQQKRVRDAVGALREAAKVE